jgi:metal-responsive CopG/Arc/MetJ family transcriptional regulator
MPRGAPTVLVAVRVPLTLLHVLDVEAARLHLNRSELIRRLLAGGLDQPVAKAANR